MRCREEEEARHGGRVQSVQCRKELSLLPTNTARDVPQDKICKRAVSFSS